MQKFTQKYTIIQLFEPTEEGYEFASNNWPLHSTIADTFSINWDVATLVKELLAKSKNFKEFSVIALNDQLFGEDSQIRVVLLEKSTELVRLHNGVMELLENGGAKFNDPQYSKDGFLPHSTVQFHGRLHINDKVKFNALSLVDMFPSENPYRRKILKTIKFNDNSL